MSNKYPKLIGEPLDYSKGSNWLTKQDNGNCKVDVFYLYPTAANPTIKEDISLPDQYMRFSAIGNFERGPSCFGGICNIFAPYYRQVTASGIVKAKDTAGLFDKVYNSEVRTDAYAALDYYFEHYNNGRPFILASHSQGSVTMFHVLKEYMKLHPEYYSRMVAAYVLGMTVNKEFMDGAEHIKFAKGEVDTGVVVCWNIEGPNATMPNMCLVNGAINCINPLNWKTDGTYAPLSLNKGSYDIKTHSVISGVADAQIDLKRMCVVTKTASQKGYITLPKEWAAFGDQSYHFDDWNFFYVNIRENAQKRIETYLDKERE